jgi:hypothetical protein
MSIVQSPQKPGRVTARRDVSPVMPLARENAKRGYCQDCPAMAIQMIKNLVAGPAHRLWIALAQIILVAYNTYIYWDHGNYPYGLVWISQ